MGGNCVSNAHTLVYNMTYDHTHRLLATLYVQAFEQPNSINVAKQMQLWQLRSEHQQGS